MDYQENCYKRGTLPSKTYSRVEQYLRELCLLEDAPLPIPQSRIELLLEAIFTGDISKCESPKSREEKLIWALLTGDESDIEKCASRIEVLWYCLVKGLNAEELLGTEVNGKVIEDCMSRIEAYLWYLVKNGGSSLMGVEYELYDFVTTYNTMNTNLLKAVSSGETMNNIVSDNAVSDVQSVVGYGSIGDKVTEKFQSAILKGETIKISELSIQKHGSSSGGTLWLHSDVIDIFKPNTLYTFFYEIEISNLESVNEEITVTNDSRSAFPNGLKLGAQQEGIQVFCFEQLSKTSFENVDRYGLRFANFNGTVLVKKALYCEGSYSTTITNWESGLKSVKMPILQTTGKNLFDMNAIVKDDFELDKYQGSYYGKEFVLQPNTTYTIKPYLREEITSTSVWTVFNIINKNSVLEVINVDKTGTAVKNVMRTITFTTDSTGKVSYSIYAHLNSEVSWLGNLPFNIQLEEGSTATPYEPYKSNILSTPEDLELRGIGAVKDELNLMTGELTQRIDEIVLNGSQSRDHNYNGVFDSVYRIGILHSEGKETALGNQTISYCDKLVSGFDWNGDYEHCYAGKSAIILFINKEKIGELNDENIKKYLQQNPITVQYQLATEVIKTVDFSIVDQDGNTIESIKPFTNGHIITSSATLNPELEYTLVESNKFNVPALESKEYTVQNDGTNFTLNNVEYTHGITEKTIKGGNEALTVIPNGYSTDGYEKFVIEGQTYQNILPEPTLRNSVKNVKMQKINEGYDNVNVVDGVAKSAILSGQTLVNKTTIKRNGFINKVHTTLFDSSVIEPNKRYYIRIKNNGTETLKLYGYLPGYTEITLNINEEKILTPTFGSTINPNIITVHQAQTQPQNLDGMIIEYQEGMENWDIPYFEGMKSVKMPVLTTTGSNIIKPFEEWKKGGSGATYTITGKRLEINTTEWNSRVEITQQLKPNTTYSVGWDVIENVAFRFSNTNRPTDSSPFKSFTTNESGKVIFTLKNSVQVCTMVIDGFRINEGDTDLGYEPYKSNILSTSSDLVLGKVGDVEDTLNLLTGEMVESTHEYTFNGTESNITLHSDKTNKMTFRLPLSVNVKPNADGGVICDKLKTIVLDALLTDDDVVGICTHNTEVTKNVYIAILKSELTTQDINGAKEWLSINTPTVRVVTNEKVIKTVDLSAYGNWRKIVLDGVSRVDWVHDPQFNHYYLPFSNLLKAHDYTGLIFCDNEKYTIAPSHLTVQDYDYAISGYRETHTQYDENWLYIAIKECTSKQMLLDYLSQNPITVWYQTTASQANSITEMLSFSNGHIQLSSEEGSLIPSLDYEVPTSNSYYMDLLKNNVIYTMKCENPSGKLLVKDAEITLQENRTIQIGLQYIPDDNLFINTGSWTNPMIIEGDVTSVTLPYFTGIKSSFEGESKIPVLQTTGKNLFHIDGQEIFSENNLHQIQNDEVIMENTTYGYYNCAIRYFNLKPNGVYTISYDSEILSGTPHNLVIVLDDQKNTLIRNNGTFTAPLNGKVRVNFYSGSADKIGKIRYYNIQIEEGSVATPYEPYKSNVLSTPSDLELRGIGEVQDTLDCLTGEVTENFEPFVLNGSENWVLNDDTLENTTRFILKNYVPNMVANQNVGICNNFAWGNIDKDFPGIVITKPSGHVYLRTPKMSVDELKTMLSNNPIHGYYNKEKSIKTVDLSIVNQDGETLDKLEYFNNGHIFYENEFPPQTTYKANINGFKGIVNVGTVKNNVLTATDKDIMIVEGDKTDCYIPKFKGMVSCTDMCLEIENEDGSTVLAQYPVNKDVVIRKIKDIEDTFNYLTGEYTRRIGEITFDGSENWETSITSNGKFIGIVYIENGELSNIYDDKEYQWNNGYLFCKDPYLGNLNSCWLHKVDNNTTQFRLMLDGTQTLADEFKEYVTNNPITIQYALAEPIVTKVDVNLTKDDMRSFEGITKFRVEKNDSMLFPSKTVVTVRTSNDTDLALLSDEISTLSVKQNDTSNTISNTSEDIENVSKGLSEINSLLE